MPYFPYLFFDDRFQNFFRHYCSPRDHDPHALFLRPRPMRPGSQWIRSRWGAGEILASPISKTTCRRKVLYVQRSKHFGPLLSEQLSIEKYPLRANNHHFLLQISPFFVYATKVVSTSLLGPLNLDCLLTVSMKRKV